MNGPLDWLVLIGLVASGAGLLSWVWHGQYTGKWNKP